jgi:hypothetical protein
MTMERRLLHRLRLVERWLDRTVTGGLAKAFPSPVAVIELESALRAECDARVASLSGGREVAPNEYAVTLAPEELRTEDESALVERLTAMLNEHVRSKGYSLAAPVAIRVSRDDAAVMGVPRIRSAILAHQLHEESPSTVYLTVGTRRIGLPEGIYPIVEATLYLATAPKSNSSGAYFKAFQLIEDEGRIEVPTHLQDATRDAKALGHGAGYKYPHEGPAHFLPQQYLPRPLLGTYFYQPSDQGYEAQVVERLKRWREAQRRALGITQTSEIPDLSHEAIQEIKHKHKGNL